MNDFQERLERVEQELGDLQEACDDRQGAKLERARWQVMSVLASLGSDPVRVGVIGGEGLDEPCGWDVEGVGDST